ncbi:Glycine--tRNA ligase beta subunit [Frankliniella fusca]|uniref:Glycine--tRNA ligase beta subunit n=1 Tax=Frankliniella fusca TaxID=407009 RepID=A0AAE1LQD6_9NEOP|nr:Glycine--tRNA ligase beta subunit [Frankliniella fusca]
MSWSGHFSRKAPTHRNCTHHAYVFGRHIANATLKNQLLLEKHELLSTPVVKGKEFYRELTAEELELLREHVPNAQQRIPIYSRVQQGKTVFTSLWYTAAEHATDNKNVLFKTDDNTKVFGVLKFFYENDGEVFAFFNSYDVDEFRFRHNDTNLSVSHIIRVHETEVMCVMPFKNILSKVIKVGHYVCVPPNRFEKIWTEMN